MSGTPGNKTGRLEQPRVLDRFSDESGWSREPPSWGKGCVCWVSVLETPRSGTGPASHRAGQWTGPWQSFPWHRSCWLCLVSVPLHVWSLELGAGLGYCGPGLGPVSSWSTSTLPAHSCAQLWARLSHYPFVWLWMGPRSPLSFLGGLVRQIQSTWAESARAVPWSPWPPFPLLSPSASTYEVHTPVLFVVLISLMDLFALICIRNTILSNLMSRPIWQHRLPLGWDLRGQELL